VGLEQGPLSLVSTIEELLERKSSGSGLEIREYGRRDTSLWPRDTFYQQKFALISPTSGGRSVGIVRSRTEETEFVFCFCINVVKSRENSTCSNRSTTIWKGRKRNFSLFVAVLRHSLALINDPSKYIVFIYIHI
jgi:hypothetical protein